MRTLLLLALIMGVGRAEAATIVNQNDLHRIVDCIKQNRCRRTLLTRTDSNGAKEVVFLADRQQYTIILGARGSALTFYIRPNGIQSPDSLTVFSDEDLDGDVDSAAQGSEHQTNQQQKRLWSLNDSFVPLGRDFQSYWNSKYSDAIRVAARTLCNSSR